MENYLDIIGAMCGSNESGGGNPEEVLAEANAYTDEKVLSESTIRTNSDTNLQYQISELQAAKVDKEEGKGLSTTDFTLAEKAKLSGIATGAEVNVQSDWNTAGTDADSYIANKPSIFMSST